jgi:hypothetical protein
MSTELLGKLRAARATIDEAILALTPTSPPPASIIRRGDNLQSVLEQAADHATFYIEPDFELAANLKIVKPVLLASTLSGGGRVDAGLTGPLLTGAHTILAPDVVLRGLQLFGRVKDSTILTTGPSTLVSRCLVIGSGLGQHRGLAVNSPDVTVQGSHIANIWHDSRDCQAICGWDGTARLLVDDCYLEASAENFMLGGSDPSSPEAIPQDVELRHSTLAKPVGWRSASPRPLVKNLLELKNCKRVKVHDNLLEYAWAGGQIGFALVLTVRNQGGDAPYSTIEDVEITTNLFRHMAGGVQILGRDNLQLSERMARVALRSNRFEDIGSTWGSAGRQVYISGGPLDLTLEDNWFDGGGLNTAFLFDQPQHPCEGLRLIRNRMMEGTYGIHDATGQVTQGKAVLDKYAPGYVWEAMTLVRTRSGNRYTYPLGTTIIEAA